MPTVTWRFPTMVALVPFLAERMGIALEAEAADPAAGRDRPAATTATDPSAAARSTEAADAPPDLDAMSAAELEALVLAKTQQIDEGGRR